jgi:hypothetical protein
MECDKQESWVLGWEERQAKKAGSCFEVSGLRQPNSNHPGVGEVH